MELRESSTSEAVRRCCGSKTSSFRIKHTVFSETRPSLGERARGEAERTRRAEAAAGWTCWEHGARTGGATIALTETPELTRRLIPCPCSTGPFSPLRKMSQLRYRFLGVYCVQSLFSLLLRPSGALIEAPPAPAVPVWPRAPPAQALREGPPRDRLYSLRDGVLGSLDFAEKLLRYAVVEGELAIEHGEEHHTQRPHVTGFSTVRPSCREQGDTKATGFMTPLASAAHHQQHRH